MPYRSGSTTGLCLAGLFSLLLLPLAAAGQTATDHIAPSILTMGSKLADESPSAMLNLTVWLNLRNRSVLDARVKDLYTPGSPNFHKWLSAEDLKQFAPTAAQVDRVKLEIASRGLTVRSVDNGGFAIRVQGTKANFETALQTRIGRYMVRGHAVRTTAAAPHLGGLAEGLVARIGGLNSMPAKPLIAKRANPLTGRPFVGTPLTSSGNTEGIVYSGQCFYLPRQASQTGLNPLNGSPVQATEAGLVYGASLNNSTTGTLPPCGYSAAQVQGFYGMSAAYQRGLTGTGQTIVIVDAYTQDQAMADANVFNHLNNLPAFTSQNYQVYNPFGADEPGSLFGTDVETDLDVEWAHAIAPGANIALVIAPGPEDEDMQAAILYAVQEGLGNVISMSYGLEESYTGPLGAQIFDQIAELAAARGISIHVASGDSGDFTSDGVPPDVNGWGSSPYDTVVGGTSIGTSPADGSMVTVGWGNNVNVLTHGTNPTLIYDPPSQNQFYGGSGGGASRYFSKPAYQASLPGTKRLMPDVSALADPFTGAEIVYDVDGVLYLDVVGGTSLAAPLFSGMWAIANEFNGGSLGQAAPIIATLPSSVINDVVPYAGPANVSETLVDRTGTHFYADTVLAQPLETTAPFLSALWNAAPGEFVVLTFGTDTSLRVTPGWDNVTGFGTPNMAALFNLY